MDRDLLQHLPIIATVARRRSFAGAAAELGLGASAVSHAVRLVEERLCAPLFVRTTRSVSLTETGEAFLTRAGPALAEIQEAIEAARALKGSVTGTLRINAPRVAATMVLTELLTELAMRHADLTVEVTSEDGFVDIVAQGFDAGVRLGEAIADDMIVVRLTPPFKVIMVAAPHYLARFGSPKRLTELQAHNCIGYRQVSTGATYAWDLQEDGRDVAVSVSGTARVTDPIYAIELALAGVGLAYVFEPTVRDHIRTGALQWVLPDAAIEESGLFLYFPRRQSEAPKLRAFIDVARARLAK
jgi:DNA-binding transcriptional LysR family regulator